MSKLSRDDVLKLAALSKLKLSEEEIETFRSQLTEILDYVEILDKVEVNGLQPTYQVTGLTNVMRADEIKSYSTKPADLLANAPALKDNHYKVRRVLG